MKRKLNLKRVFALILFLSAIIALYFIITRTIPFRPMFQMDGVRFAEKGVLDGDVNLLALKPWMIIQQETTGVPKSDGEAYGIPAGTQIYTIRAEQNILNENIEYKDKYDSVIDQNDIVALYRKDDKWVKCYASGKADKTQKNAKTDEQT